MSVASLMVLQVSHVPKMAKCSLGSMKSLLNSQRAAGHLRTVLLSVRCDHTPESCTTACWEYGQWVRRANYGHQRHFVLLRSFALHLLKVLAWVMDAKLASLELACSQRQDMARKRQSDRLTNTNRYENNWRTPWYQYQPWENNVSKRLESEIKESSFPSVIVSHPLNFQNFVSFCCW